MIVGSVCSGIAADALAWHPLGWRHTFFSEIAAFPSRVLAARWPGVPNLGDFTKIKASDETRIDVLVGGTPCQSFSLAGLRGGLDDSRGQLALEFLRLADRLAPRWIVWENVPGVLSADEGRAFGSFLGGLGELGYGWAYRILDAQFFGLAQRRKRVFVVGRAGGSWQRAAAVLLERSGLCGDPRASGAERESVAGCLEARAGKGGYGTDAHGAASGHLQVAHTLRGAGFDASEDGTGRGTPLVVAGTIGTLGDRGGFDGGQGDPRSLVIPFDTTQVTSGENRSTCEPGSPSPVRRLMPIECERLMGMPDGYTAIDGAKDGPRYAALGNSIAVPVLAWIGRRIEAVERIA